MSDIQRLQDENERLRQEVERLRRENAYLRGDRVESDQAEASLTPDEKIRLFQKVFRGRQDVFALRWESRTVTNMIGRYVAAPKTRVSSSGGSITYVWMTVSSANTSRAASLQESIRYCPMIPACFSRWTLTNRLGSGMQTVSAGDVKRRIYRAISSVPAPETARMHGSSSPNRSLPGTPARWGRSFCPIP